MTGDAIATLAVLFWFGGYIFLIVYLLMWVAPRYWLSNVKLDIDPELRKPFQ